MVRFVTLILTGVLCFNTLASQCDNNQVHLQVLGSGGPELDDGLNSSGYLIWYQGKAQVLVDTGAGSSVQYGKTGAQFEDLQAILLTHLHVDHSADLPSFIKGSYFTNRLTHLDIYGPSANDLMPSTSEYVQHLMGNKGAFAYLEEYTSKDLTSDYKVIAHDVPLNKGQISVYSIGEYISAKATFVHHGPVAAVAWRVEVAGCDVVFSGDMSNQFDVLANFAKGADLLIANHAVPENASSVGLNLHMPPSIIGQIAQKAVVKHLVLSHFMNRTLAVKKPSLKIIRQYYQGPITLASDGLIVDL